jgi:aminoglycoside/choline kinase family phosphotransferase
LKTSRLILHPTRTTGFLSQTFHAARPGDARKYILKVGSDQPVAQKFSRHIRAFQRELLAYQLLKPLGGKHVPRCIASASVPDGSDGLILLQEIFPCRTGDQIQGLSFRQLSSAAKSIGAVHARFWNSNQLRKIKALPLHHYNRAHEAGKHAQTFLRHCRSLLTKKDVKRIQYFLHTITQALRQAQKRPITLVHGDLRADNLLLVRSNVFIVDWQIATRGLGAFDLARVIGGSSAHPLPIRDQYKLVGVWHQTLRQRGVRGYNFTDAWRDYQIGVALTLSIPITNGSTLVQLSTRGRKIARLMVRRFFQNAEIVLGI